MAVEDKPKKSNVLWWVIGAIVLLIILAAVAMSSDSFNTQVTTQEEVTPSTPIVDNIDEELSPQASIEGIMSIEDLTENPEQYVGQTVTVRAEVEDWLAPRVFTLDAPGIIGDQLLVITDDPNNVFEDQDVFGDDIWEVEGILYRDLVIDDVTSQYDLDMDQEDMLMDFEDGYYLVADRVEMVEDGMMNDQE